VQRATAASSTAATASAAASSAVVGDGAADGEAAQCAKKKGRPVGVNALNWVSTKTGDALKPGLFAEMARFLAARPVEQMKPSASFEGFLAHSRLAPGHLTFENYNNHLNAFKAMCTNVLEAYEALNSAEGLTVSQMMHLEGDALGEASIVLDDVRGKLGLKYHTAEHAEDIISSMLRIARTLDTSQKKAHNNKTKRALKVQKREVGIARLHDKFERTHGAKKKRRLEDGPDEEPRGADWQSGDEIEDDEFTGRRSSAAYRPRRASDADYDDDDADDGDGDDRGARDRRNGHRHDDDESGGSDDDADDDGDDDGGGGGAAASSAGHRAYTASRTGSAQRGSAAHERAGARGGRHHDDRLSNLLRMAGSTSGIEANKDGRAAAVRLREVERKVEKEIHRVDVQLAALDKKLDKVLCVLERVVHSKQDSGGEGCE
jgi:hypothetical protein